MKDALGNEYGKPRDVIGEKRMAFTSHADSAFDVCFENIIVTRKASKRANTREAGRLTVDRRSCNEPSSFDRARC